MAIKILEKNVIATWGEVGKSWLEQLPKIIAQLSQHWGLSEIKPVDNMSYNYVAKAAQHDRAVVLKISCDKQLIDDEYRALKHFNGQGSIEVIDIHRDLNALLLVQAIPGNLLKCGYLDDIQNAILVYSDVVKALASHPRASRQYAHVKTWCDAIDGINDNRIKPHYIAKAKELRDFLLSSMERQYLCHGDLHLENIIHHGGQWLCIDPKGIIGEIAFEAAAFDFIDNSEWFDIELIQDKIINRTALLANALGIGNDRLLAWIYLRAIISAQWFIEDNGDPDKMLKLTAALYPLLTRDYHKHNVCLTYEKISDWYHEQRCQDLFEKYYLDYVISNIPAAGSILDLGCGTGQPIAEYFIKKRFSVTGIDGSQSQLIKAKKFVPHMQTICDDMRHLHLEKKFDCIIAWHSFFHLSQDDQRNMFSIFEEHIKSNGLLVFTSGPMGSEIWSDNGGEMLYHASLSEAEYRNLLNKYHFQVLRHKVEDPNCGDTTVWVAKYGEKHGITG